MIPCPLIRSVRWALVACLLASSTPLPVGQPLPIGRAAPVFTEQALALPEGAGFRNRFSGPISAHLARLAASLEIPNVVQGSHDPLAQFLDDLLVVSETSGENGRQAADRLWAQLAEKRKQVYSVAEQQQIISQAVEYAKRASYLDGHPVFHVEAFSSDALAQHAEARVREVLVKALADSYVLLLRPGDRKRQAETCLTLLRSLYPHRSQEQAGSCKVAEIIARRLVEELLADRILARYPQVDPQGLSFIAGAIVDLLMQSQPPRDLENYLQQTEGYIQKTVTLLADVTQKFQEKNLPVELPQISLSIRAFGAALASYIPETDNHPAQLGIGLSNFLRHPSAADMALCEFVVAHELGHQALDRPFRQRGIHSTDTSQAYSIFQTDGSHHPYLNWPVFHSPVNSLTDYDQQRIATALHELIAHWIAIRFYGPQAFVSLLETAWSTGMMAALPEKITYWLIILDAEGIKIDPRIRAQMEEAANRDNQWWFQQELWAKMRPALLEFYRGLAFKASSSQDQPSVEDLYNRPASGERQEDLYRMVLASNALVRDQPEGFLDLFLQMARLDVIEPGRTLTVQGHRVHITSRNGITQLRASSSRSLDEDRVYFIVGGGRVSIQINGETIDEMGPGNVVGERAVQTGKSRAATVVAKDRLVVYSLSAAEYRALFMQPVIRPHVKELKEVLPVLREWVRRQAPDTVFHDLNDFTLTVLAGRAKIRRIPARENVFDEQSGGDEFFIVTRGSVDVLKGEGANEHAIGRIGQWGHVGEISVLRGGDRTARVRTVEDVSGVMVQGDVLREILEHYPTVQARLEQDVRERISGLIAEFLNHPIKEYVPSLAEFRILLAHWAEAYGGNAIRATLDLLEKHLLHLSEQGQAELAQDLRGIGLSQTAAAYWNHDIQRPFFLGDTSHAREPVPDNSIDIAWITHFFENGLEKVSGDPAQFYRTVASELFRILRPGGVVYLFASEAVDGALHYFSELGFVKKSFVPGLYELTKPWAAPLRLPGLHPAYNTLSFKSDLRGYIQEGHAAQVLASILQDQQPWYEFFKGHVADQMDLEWDPIGEYSKGHPQGWLWNALLAQAHWAQDGADFKRRLVPLFHTEHLLDQLRQNDGLGDLQLGAQQLIKIRLYRELEAGQDPERVYEKAAQETLPFLRVLEKLDQPLSTSGLEAHRIVYRQEEEQGVRAAVAWQTYFLGVGRHEMPLVDVRDSPVSDGLVMLDTKILPAKPLIAALLLQEAFDLPETKSLSHFWLDDQDPVSPYVHYSIAPKKQLKTELCRLLALIGFFSEGLPDTQLAPQASVGDTSSPGLGQRRAQTVRTTGRVSRNQKQHNFMLSTMMHIHPDTGRWHPTAPQSLSMMALLFFWAEQEPEAFTRWAENLLGVRTKNKHEPLDETAMRIYRLHGGDLAWDVSWKAALQRAVAYKSKEIREQLYGDVAELAADLGDASQPVIVRLEKGWQAWKRKSIPSALPEPAEPAQVQPVIREAEPWAPLSLEEASVFLRRWAQDAPWEDYREDVERAITLVQAITLHPIQRVLVAGMGIQALPVLLALIGKEVVYVDENPALVTTMKLFTDLFRRALRADERPANIPMAFIRSEMGALDLAAHNIDANRFDLVTFVDLMGGIPTGSPEAWLLKAKELLQTHEAYLVIDEQEGLQRSLLDRSFNHLHHHFPKIFPDHEIAERGPNEDGSFSGSYPFPPGINRFYRVKPDSSVHPPRFPDDVLKSRA